MTKHAENDASSVTPLRDFDKELDWWGNASIFWSFRGPSGSPSPMDWLNGIEKGSFVDLYGKWRRDCMGKADNDSHPLAWLPEWKRDFMTGRASGNGNEGGFPVYPVVEKLHSRGVKIMPLLSEITQTRWMIGPSKALRHSMASRKERDEEAKIVNEAAKVVEKYEPVLSPHTPTINITLPGKKESEFFMQRKSYPDPKALRWIADCLREMGPSKRNRLAEVEIQKCALKLEELIKGQIGTPCYREIGELLAAAFPEYFQPLGDIANATMKLLKRACEQ